MTNQPDLLAEGWRLYRLGQLPAAIRLAQVVATCCSDADLQAQLLQACCLIRQGSFSQADVLLSTALAVLPTNSKVAVEMCLRRAFLHIYTTGDSTFLVKESRAVLAEHPSSNVTALACNLLGRALGSMVLWNLAPVSDLIEAKQLLREAVSQYHCSGNFHESLASLLKLGEMYSLSASPDPKVAQKIFEQVQKQAQSLDNKVIQAEVLLRLAELNFDYGSSTKTVANDKKMDLTLYEKAIAVYEEVGHVLGRADVLLSAGSRLIEAGFDGSHAIQQAFDIYQSENNQLGCYSTLNTLGLWYMRQGDLVEAKNCYKRAAALAKQINFIIGESSAYLGIANYFYWTGDYAHALAAYEQAELLSLAPVKKAIVKMTLATVYSMMNLPDRAETACREGISFLASSSSSCLSRAYQLLANILERREDWDSTIDAWQKGLAFDTACHNRQGQVEKLIGIARVTVMQHYSNGCYVPDNAYEKATQCCTQAIELLEAIDHHETAAILGKIYEQQAETAIMCDRLIDALHYLEKAEKIYTAVQLDTESGHINVLKGLVYHGIGNSGYYEFYNEAARCYEQALGYFNTIQVCDITWKIRFYLADIFWMQSFQKATFEEQQVTWNKANRLLEEAASDIELVRGRFIETNPLDREYSRLGLVADKENVYGFAIKLHQKYLGDNRGAFNWLQRLKGRAFLDSLALTFMRSPVLADETLLEKERELLNVIHCAFTQSEVVESSERLHTLWTEMANDPAAAEYVSLRQGQPLDWETVQSLLAVISSDSSS